MGLRPPRPRSWGTPRARCGDPVGRSGEVRGYGWPLKTWEDLGFNGILMGFNGIWMGFEWDFMGFNGIYWDFCGWWLKYLPYMMVIYMWMMIEIDDSGIDIYWRFFFASNDRAIQFGPIWIIWPIWWVGFGVAIDSISSGQCNLVIDPELYGDFLRWGYSKIIINFYFRMFHEINHPAVRVPAFMETSV